MKTTNRFVTIEYIFNEEKRDYEDKVTIDFHISKTNVTCTREEIEQLYYSLRNIYED